MVHRANISTDSKTSHRKLNSIMIAVVVCELAKRQVTRNELTESDCTNSKEEWKRLHDVDV